MPASVAGRRGRLGTAAADRTGCTGLLAIRPARRWAQAAFDKTTFGELLQGDLGELLGYARQVVVKRLTDASLGNSLAGKRPEELVKIQSAARQFSLLWPAIDQHGVAVGVETNDKDHSARAIVVFPQGKSLLTLAQLIAGQIGPAPAERKVKDRDVFVSQSARRSRPTPIRWTEALRIRRPANLYPRQAEKTSLRRQNHRAARRWPS